MFSFSHLCIQTKTSVIASMLGAGYVLGKDAVDRAVQYDSINIHFFFSLSNLLKQTQHQ
jgi:hypothetical protein